MQEGILLKQADYETHKAHSSCWGQEQQQDGKDERRNQGQGEGVQGT